MPKKSYKKKHLTSFQLIILGFAGVILLGSFLLMLPFSSVDRTLTPFHEALFTATSAVCVTGLVVKDTGSYWSVAGQTDYSYAHTNRRTWSGNCGCIRFHFSPGKKYPSCKEAPCRMRFLRLRLVESSD